MKHLKEVICLNLLVAQAFCCDQLPPLEEVRKGECKQVRLTLIRPIPIPAHKMKKKHLQQKHQQEEKPKVLTREEVLEINIKHVKKTLKKWITEETPPYDALISLSELFDFGIDIRERIKADMVTYLIEEKGYTEESALKDCAPIPSPFSSESASFSENELSTLAPLKALKQKPEVTKKIPNSPIAKRTNSRSDAAENQKRKICKSFFSCNYKPLRFKITPPKQHAKKYMR